MVRMSAPMKEEIVKKKYKAEGKSFDEEMKKLLSTGQVRTTLAAIDLMYRELEIETIEGQVEGYFMGSYPDTFNPNRVNNYILMQKKAVKISSDANEFNAPKFKKIKLSKVLFKTNITTQNQWCEIGNGCIMVEMPGQVDELYTYVNSVMDIYEPGYYAAIGYVKFVNAPAIWGEDRKKIGNKQIFEKHPDKSEKFNLKLSIAEDESGVNAASVTLYKPEQIIPLYPQGALRSSPEEHIAWLREQADDITLNELSAIRDEMVFVFGRGMGYISRKGEKGEEVKEELNVPFIGLDEGFAVNMSNVDIMMGTLSQAPPQVQPAIEPEMKRQKDTVQESAITDIQHIQKEQPVTLPSMQIVTIAKVSTADLILKQIDDGKGTQEGIIELIKEGGVMPEDLRGTMQSLLTKNIIIKDGNKFVRATAFLGV